MSFLKNLEKISKNLDFLCFQEAKLKKPQVSHHIAPGNPGKSTFPNIEKHDANQREPMGEEKNSTFAIFVDRGRQTATS